jgi:glycosyltransferase involved in cell wall biosynthesis
MKDCNISVIIPAYNASRYIEKALDSVRNQEFKEYEVIVINDGSVDNTPIIVNDYLSRYQKFPGILINQTNKGIGGATNAALSYAKGKFISLLDADDYWYPAKLERVIRFLATHPDTDVVCHDVREIRKNICTRILKARTLKKPFFEDLLINYNGLFRSATTIRRKIIDEVGCFSEERELNGADDYDLWLRLAIAGAHFAHLNELLGEYHRVEDSLTSKIIEHSSKGYEVRRKYLNYLANEGKYSDKYITRISHKIETEYLYSLARDFHQAGELQKAKEYYDETKKKTPLWIRPYLGILLISLHSILKTQRC